MSTKNIIRAWKDEAYRESLSEAERDLLPQNPAGIVELTDVDLGGAAGGLPRHYTSTPECPTYQPSICRTCRLSIGYCP